MLVVRFFCYSYRTQTEYIVHVQSNSIVQVSLNLVFHMSKNIRTSNVFLAFVQTSFNFMEFTPNLFTAIVLNTTNALICGGVDNNYFQF